MVLKRSGEKRLVSTVMNEGVAYCETIADFLKS